MTDNEIKQIRQTIKRQQAITKEYGLPKIDETTLALQLAQVRQHIDFDRLLSFAKTDFVHDVYGVHSHVKMGMQDFSDCWYPRSGKEQEPSVWNVAIKLT